MRLTPIAKLMITLIVVISVWLGIRTYGPPRLPHLTGAAVTARDDHEHDHAAVPRPRSSAKLVVGVSEFGGAYPGLVANDGATPGPRSRFKARDLNVEFKLIRDPKERLLAFERREIDILLMTLDYMADLEPAYHDKGVELRAFLMTNWSRGNVGLVASSKVQSVEDLRNVKVASLRNSEGHFFLLMMLRDSNLGTEDIDHVRAGLIFATKPAFAVDMFRRGDVAALATTEPYLSQALAQGQGHHLLISTATATNLIAELLCARADFLREREADIIAFTRAWFEGGGLAVSDPRASAQHFAQAARLSEAEAQKVLAQVKLATFADNREFFGLEHEHALYMELFDDAEVLWKREGLIKREVPAAQTRWLHALEAVAAEHSGEAVHEDFRFRKGPRKDARPLLTKSVTIYFASASSELDANARRIIDGFAEELDEFGNTYVRVEGHTDSVGAKAKNVELSRRRAQAVVDDLVARHRYDQARFQVVGHGADKPKASNTTQAGRDLNRRTDFMILQND